MSNSVAQFDRIQTKQGFDHTKSDVQIISSIFIININLLTHGIVKSSMFVLGKKVESCYRNLVTIN